MLAHHDGQNGVGVRVTRRAETVQECLGLALRAWRVTHGFNQTEMALKMGVGQSALSRAENGLVTVDAMLLVHTDHVWVVREAKRIAARDGVEWP